MPTEAQKQDRTINQILEILRIYFCIKTKKFDKKVVVDKSTYRPEWVPLPRSLDLISMFLASLLPKGLINYS